MATLKKGIDSTLLLAVYTRKQKTFQEFAQDAKVPIPGQLMVTTGTKHTLQCGGLMQALHEWRWLLAIQHMWLNWKNHWTAIFNEQQDIWHLTGGTFMAQANAAVDDSQWLSQMITSLDILANAADTHNALPNPKAPQPISGTQKGTTTSMVTELTSGITAKLADIKSLVTNKRPLNKTQWEVVKKINLSNQMDVGVHQQGQIGEPKIIKYSIPSITPFCANPPDLITIAILDT
ncbi:hypothetical protein ACHAW6_003285 [Cyclotella cf. meneghiniana]